MTLIGLNHSILFECDIVLEQTKYGDSKFWNFRLVIYGKWNGKHFPCFPSPYRYCIQFESFYLTMSSLRYSCMERQFALHSISLLVRIIRLSNISAFIITRSLMFTYFPLFHLRYINGENGYTFENWMSFHT